MSTKTEADHELIETVVGCASARGPLPGEVRDRLADEVIDELLAQLTKRLVEWAMSAELTEHLGY